MFSAFAARIARTNSPPATDSSLQAFAASLLGSGLVNPTTGSGDLVLNGQNLGPWDWSSSNSAVLSSFTNSSWFSTTDDRCAFVIINGDLTINSGVTFIPTNRKKFVCIYVNGSLSLSGSISMTGRGAADAGTQFIQLTASHRVDSTGASGGASRSTDGAGNAGSAYSGTYYGTGGGGGGPARSQSGQGIGGSGSAGNAFGGGSGGGGSATSALAGGNGVTGGAGGTAGGLHNGGCGNPSGAASNADSTVESGTGGVVIVFATGGVTGSGSIVANGANNTGVNNSSPSTAGGAGGASGGGCVVLFGPSNAAATLSATGGTSSVAGSFPNGSAGGNGGNGSAAFVVI